MNIRLSRWIIGLVLVGAFATVLTGTIKIWADSGAVIERGTQVQAAVLLADANTAGPSVDRLKAEAFRAIRQGKFDETNQKLTEAAAMIKDPVLTRMAMWTNDFEKQRAVFAKERHGQFDKAVDEVKLLLKNHKDRYAIDVLARAHLLADDKKAFRQLPWVDEIVQNTIKVAADYETTEQWLKALRLYSELGSLEPGVPTWKDKLKECTRRVRLLALYVPDELKAMQEVESKEREEVDALLHPATQPAATKPATNDIKNDNFKTDWHDTLRGVTMEMLTDALADARQNYYRDVSYRTMMLGGLKGLKAVLTTKGLEKAFPSLGVATKRVPYIDRIDALIARAKDSTAANEQSLLRVVLKTVELTNLDTVNLPEPVLVNEFADGAFAELDPFSNMIWPSDREEFEKTTQGEFSGVGIQIQTDDDGSLRVVSPLEDSPAYKAGIKAGDIITHINGKNAKGITVNQAVKNITGPSGTMVTLTVRSPSGKSKDYLLKRETIKVASIKGWSHRPGGGWEYFVDSDQKIAYLRLTNFTKTTSQELRAALDDLSQTNTRGIILDLRYNPGGLLTAAIEVCESFIRRGTIVSTRADREDSPNPPTVSTASGIGNECELPLIVLVNQYSASASEIVSGALKDQHRALVVGERTFGKGSVQMLFPLADRKAFLKLTTSHYYLPSGRCIHREENSTEWGVEPDVSVEVTPEQMRTAIDARQELDVLRNANDPAAPEAPAANADPGKIKKDPLNCDAQLSAAILLMRLQLNGASF